MKQTQHINRAYLRPRDAAIYTSISIDTLKELRSRNEGPPWIKLDRLVLYKIDELDRFMEAQTNRMPGAALQSQPKAALSATPLAAKREPSSAAARWPDGVWLLHSLLMCACGWRMIQMDS
jgi:hypothetical protein